MEDDCQSNNKNVTNKENQQRFSANSMEMEAQGMYTNHQGALSQQLMYDPLQQQQQQQQQMMMSTANYHDGHNYYPTIERTSHGQQQMISPRHLNYPLNSAEFLYGNPTTIYPQLAHQPLLASAPQTLPYQAIQQPYDNCPTICSLFAIFCCPITCPCSLPALVYSLCAYTDYRADDLHHYRKKSDKARHLVISACLLGLLLCVTWAILIFFYYDQMVIFLSEFIRLIKGQSSMRNKENS